MLCTCGVRVICLSPLEACLHVAPRLHTPAYLQAYMCVCSNCGRFCPPHVHIAIPNLEFLLYAEFIPCMYGLWPFLATLRVLRLEAIVRRLQVTFKLNATAL